jgi:hypothetical protein
VSSKRALNGNIECLLLFGKTQTTSEDHTFGATLDSPDRHHGEHITKLDPDYRPYLNDNTNNHGVSERDQAQETGHAQQEVTSTSACYPQKSYTQGSSERHTSKSREGGSSRSISLFTIQGECATAGCQQLWNSYWSTSKCGGEAESEEATEGNRSCRRDDTSSGEGASDSSQIDQAGRVL